MLCIFGVVARIASSTRCDARVRLSSPFCSPVTDSSIPMAAMAAIGLMTFFPVYFGAEPPMHSNMLQPPGSGLMLPPALTPRPPLNHGADVGDDVPEHVWAPRTVS